MDSTFYMASCQIPKPYSLDTSLYKLEQSDNIWISFDKDPNCFEYMATDTGPYVINLVSKKTKKKITLAQGSTKSEINFNRYGGVFYIKEKQTINTPFPSMKLYDPEITHLNILKPKYVHSDAVFKGKITIVHIWEYGCGPCMEDVPVFNDLADSLKNSAVQLIGIHRGLVVRDKGVYAFTRGKAEAVAVSMHFPQYPMSDPVMKKMGIISFPTTYILDKQGIIRDIISGHPSEGSKTGEVKEILQRLRYYEMY